MEINIIGMGIGRNLAPDTGIRWGLTRLIFDTPVDVIFSVHQNDSDIQKRIVSRCEESDTLCYTCDNYPLNEMIEEFGTDYFTSSFDYAMAMAITLKPECINLYGVNMSRRVKVEYAHQKPGGDFWTGFAMGRGIKVNIFGSMSEIRRSKDGLLYGYLTKQRLQCTK